MCVWTCSKVVAAASAAAGTIDGVADVVVDLGSDESAERAMAAAVNKLLPPRRTSRAKMHPVLSYLVLIRA